MQVQITSNYETTDRGVKLHSIVVNGLEVLARHNPRRLAQQGRQLGQSVRTGDGGVTTNIPAEEAFKRLVKRPFNVSWDLVSVKGEMGIAETTFDGRNGTVDLYFLPVHAVAETNRVEDAQILQFFTTIITTYMPHSDAQVLLDKYMLL